MSKFSVNLNDHIWLDLSMKSNATCLVNLNYPSSINNCDGDFLVWGGQSPFSYDVYWSGNICK